MCTKTMYVCIFVLTISNLILCPSLKSAETINLPQPYYKSTTSVEEALQDRRSRREFDDDKLQLSQISQILWSAYGITKPMPNAPDFLRGGFKTAPSAGARYPLEIYVLAHNVEGLERGIYKFKVAEHELTLVKKGSFMEQLVSASYNQSWIGEAAAAIIYTAVYERISERYGERGRERYVCMDLGHSAQNIYLQCESLNLSTCAVGAFNDSKVGELFEIKDKETPLYIMPLGKRK